MLQVLRQEPVQVQQRHLLLGLGERLQEGSTKLMQALAADLALRVLLAALQMTQTVSNGMMWRVVLVVAGMTRAQAYGVSC